MDSKKSSRLRRARKARAHIRRMGKPRLTVFRSGRHIYAQVINAEDGHVIAAASTLQKDVRGDLGSTSNKEVRGGKGSSPSKAAASKGGASALKEPLYLTLREKRIESARQRREAAVAISIMTGPASEVDEEEKMRKKLVLRAVEMQTKNKDKGRGKRGRDGMPKQQQQQPGSARRETDEDEDDDESRPLNQKRRRTSENNQQHQQQPDMDTSGTRSKREKVILPARCRCLSCLSQRLQRHLCTVFHCLLLSLSFLFPWFCPGFLSLFLSLGNTRATLCQGRIASSKRSPYLVLWRMQANGLLCEA